MKIHVPQFKGRCEIGAKIRLSGISQGLRQALIKMCTHANPGYLQTVRYGPWGPPSSAYQYIIVADDEGDAVVVPRGKSVDRHLEDFTSKQIKELKALRRVDDRLSVPCDWPEWTLPLNPRQEEVLRIFNNAQDRDLRPNGNNLISVPTAEGKTIAMTKIAHGLGQRTLIVCLTNLILRVWKDDLEKCFPGMHVGWIQQNRFDIGDQVTVASLSTLGKRRAKLWDKIYETFGTVIMDECHRVTGRTVYEFLTGFPGRYVLGCTATHQAKTKNFYIEAALGLPIVKLNLLTGHTPTSMPLSGADIIQTDFKYETEGGIDYNHMLELMQDNEERNNQIIDQVTLEIEEGHTILITTKRHEHVNLLYEMLKEAGIRPKKLTGVTNSDRAYTDKLFKDLFAGKVKCLISTVAAIEMGVNINPVDRIHICMPIGDSNSVSQLIGRGRRTFKGKKDFRVVYYLDSQTSYLKNIYNKSAVPVFRKMKVEGFTDKFGI